MSEVTKQFTGITVDEIINNIYILETENGDVQINQNLLDVSENCKIVEFSFKMNSPSRFRIDFFLPEDVINACVTLNNRILLGLFSPNLPEGCIKPYSDECTGSGYTSEDHEKISTLLPGRYQSINFKWFKTDNLKFYLYY